MREFLDRFPRKDIHSPIDNSVYLRRWTLIRFWGRKLMVHHIVRPDYAREQHDHPWWFISFIMKGSYTEITDVRTRIHGRFAVLFRRATFRHAIRIVSPGGAWTLVLRGRVTRLWGFWSEDFKRWISHELYEKVGLSLRGKE